MSPGYEKFGTILINIECKMAKAQVGPVRQHLPGEQRRCHPDLYVNNVLLLGKGLPDHAEADEPFFTEEHGRRVARARDGRYS